MTKTELIKAIKEKMPEHNLKDIEATLKAAVEVIGDTVKAGEKVTITCLGTFSPKEQKACIRRNPKTGGSVQVPAKRGVKFKPGKELKDKVNS